MIGPLRDWLRHALPRAPGASGGAAEPSLGGLFVRGLAMGAAEVVPGVSGGTIAFVTGIYDELVRSLARVSPRSLEVLLRQGWRSFAAAYNVAFFLFLGAGMAASFLAVANLVDALLANHRGVVFGFFFGLIAASVFHVGAQSTWRALATCGLLGLVLGAALGWQSEPGADRSLDTLATFGAGALASTAWLLPGVSGAFMLLLLGLYGPLLAALTGGDWSVIAPFVGGVAVGVVAFSKLLAWLLARVRAPLLAVLTGFLAGSLTQLWPWRHAAADSPLPIVLAAMAGGALVAAALGVAALRRKGRLAHGQDG